MQQMAFSNHLDVYKCDYIWFDLVAVSKDTSNIEISVDYGPSMEYDGMLTANVWARIGDSKIKGYICTEEVPVREVEEKGFAEIANILHHSKDFLDGLRSFASWAYSSGIVK